MYRLNQNISSNYELTRSPSIFSDWRWDGFRGSKKPLRRVRRRLIFCVFIAFVHLTWRTFLFGVGKAAHLAMFVANWCLAAVDHNDNNYQSIRRVRCEEKVTCFTLESLHYRFIKWYSVRNESNRPNRSIIFYSFWHPTAKLSRTWRRLFSIQLLISTIQATFLLDQTKSKISPATTWFFKWTARRIILVYTVWMISD